VRSGMEHLKSDENFNLGFVKNPKRLNVAVTRAKALLIIVGNPHVLQRDVCWRKMLQFCVDNGAYTGDSGSTDTLVHTVHVFGYALPFVGLDCNGYLRMW